jgi:hypothetical protein
MSFPIRTNIIRMMPSAQELPPANNLGWLLPCSYNTFRMQLISYLKTSLAVAIDYEGFCKFYCYIT